MHLLVIYNNHPEAERLLAFLRKADFTVDHCATYKEGKYLLTESAFDLVIIDLCIDHDKGNQWVSLLRKQHNHTPIIAIAQRNSSADIVMSFNAGVDDYLTKPSDMDVLLVRLRALLRRAQPHQCPRLQAGGIYLDSESQQAIMISNNQKIPLSSLEFRLLSLFLKYPERLFSKQQLLNALYLFDTEPESNIIERYILRLRKKLGKHCIKNHRYQGYKFIGITNGQLARTI